MQRAATDLAWFLLEPILVLASPNMSVFLLVSLQPATKLPLGRLRSANSLACLWVDGSGEIHGVDQAECWSPSVQVAPLAGLLLDVTLATDHVVWGGTSQFCLSCI